MGRPRTITDATKKKILKLHAAGLSRNEIARQTKVSASTVTRIITANGGTFDRTKTKDATRARSIDLAAARTRLAERMDRAANDMLDMIDRPFLVYNFGGKDNTFESKELDSAPVEARRTIITSAAIVFDKVSRIVERETTGTDEAVGMLDQFGKGLVAIAAELRSKDDVVDSE